MNKSSTYYRTTRSTQGEYTYLNIEIVEDKYRQFQLGPCQTELIFTWQSHVGSNEWYGGRTSISASTGGGAARAVALFKKINGIGFFLSPSDVIAALERQGIVRGVYDQRESAFIAVNKVQANDQVRWLAQNNNGGWITSIVAAKSDEETALKRLSKKVADYSLDAFEQWVIAGKPWKIDSYANAPDVREIDLTPC